MILHLSLYSTRFCYSERRGMVVSNDDGYSLQEDDMMGY